MLKLDGLCANKHKLTPSNLYIDPSGKKRCNQCRRHRANAYYKANKERLKNYYKEWEKIPKNRARRLTVSRRSALKWLYGITLTEFEQLSRKQKDRCKICGDKPNRVYKRVKHLDVDHDHKTGKVRGLLCRACNTAIGLLKEDTILIRKALNYMKRSQ